MSLNIVENSEIINFNNNKYTTFKNFEKLPLISMKTNKNFALIQNKKGKLLNKPVFSGYTKNQFSSIPRDVEIVLLNKDIDKIIIKEDKSLNTSRSRDYIFNNQIYINPYEKSKTSNAIQEMNGNLSGRVSASLSENINNKTIMPYSTNTSKSSSAIKPKKIKDLADKTKTPNYWKFYKKVENKNDASNNQSNLSIEEYQSQFYPGPSDYYGEKSFDKINQQNKYRYRSLFKSEINNKKKIKDNTPGPGSYLKINNILTSNNRHLSINLNTKEKRFKNLFNNNNPLSPWFYSSSIIDNKIKKDENKNNNLINNNGNNNKDCYDYHYYVIKEQLSDKGEKQQYYLEDKNFKIIDKEKNIKKIIKPFDNKKFKQKRHFNILLKKYINTNESKNYEIPGPGQYNIYMGFDKILKDHAIDNLKNINKQEKFIPENVLKEFSLYKKDPSLLGNEYNNERYFKKGIGSKSTENIFNPETNQSGNGTLPFISKKKRIEYHDDLLLKHTPGPCYYYNDSFPKNNIQYKRLKGFYKRI